MDKLEDIKQFALGIWDRFKWWIIGIGAVCAVLIALFWPIISAATAAIGALLKVAVKAIEGIFARVFKFVGGTS